MTDPPRDHPGRRGTVVRLLDGTEVLVRPVLPEDKAGLADGFARLSPESRYGRFFAPIAELGEDQLRFLTEVDYVDHFAWVAVLAGRPDVGVGVARYVRIPGEPRAAEAAVTVVDEYQGRGLGTILMQALAAAAVENGIRTFRGHVLRTNEPMLELLELAAARLTHDAPGVLRFELDLPGADAAPGDLPLFPVFRGLMRERGGGAR